MRKTAGIINVVALLLFAFILTVPFTVKAEDTEWGRTTLTEDTVVEGNLLVNGDLYLNDHTLTVKGDLIQESGNIDANRSSLIVEGNLISKKDDFDLRDANVTVAGDFCFSDFDSDGNPVRQSKGDLYTNSSTTISVDGSLLLNNYSTSTYIYGKWNLKGDLTDKVGMKWDNSKGLILVGSETQKLDLAKASKIVVSSTNPNIKLGKYFGGELKSNLITTSDEENTYITDSKLDLKGYKLQVSNNLVVTSDTLAEIFLNGGTLEVGGNIDFKGRTYNYFLQCDSANLIVHGDCLIRTGTVYWRYATITIDGKLIASDYDNNGKPVATKGGINTNAKTVVNVKDVYFNCESSYSVSGTWNVTGDYIDDKMMTFGDDGVLNMCGEGTQKLFLSEISKVRVKADNTNIKLGKYFAGQLLSDLITTSDEETTYVAAITYLNGHKLKVSNNLHIERYDFEARDGSLEVGGNLTFKGTGAGYYLDCSNGNLDVAGNYYHKNGVFNCQNAQVNIGGNLIMCNYDENGDEIAIQGQVSSSKDTIVNVNSLVTYFGTNTAIYGTWNVKGDYVDLNGNSWSSDSVLNMCGEKQQLLDLKENSYIRISATNENLKLGEYFAGDVMSDISFTSDEDIVCIRKESHLNGHRLKIKAKKVVLEKVDVYLNRGTLEIDGDLQYAGLITSYELSGNYSQIIVSGDFIHSSGTLRIEGSLLDVGGDIKVVDYDADGNEKKPAVSYSFNDATTIKAGGDFYYTYNQNLYGNVYVGGNYTTTSLGTSINGTLHLCGDADINNKQVVKTNSGAITKIVLSKCRDAYVIPDGVSGDITAPEHNYVDVVTKIATATKIGERTYTCSLCKDSYTEEIPKLEVGEHEHVRENIVVKKDSTIEEEGLREYTCAICKDTFEEAIPKKEHTHKWDAGVVVKKATEKEKGLKTHTCTVKNCNETYNEEIPKLEHVHKWDSGVVTKEPSVSQTGIRKYTCTSCKKTYEEKLPKLPAPTERELIEQFVSRMYTKALNRAAEEAGKTYWSDELEKQNTDGANVAFGFIFSEEFKNNNLNDEEFVNVMYATFFDRTADEGGKNYWLGLLSQGKTREMVFAGFVNSPEFEKLCSEAGIEKGLVMDDGRVVNAGIYQFVKRQYTCCLSRDGERAGMDYWATQIATRTVSADDVARKFFYSEEFVNKNYSNAEYISVLYTTFMGRPSDQGGLNYWEEQMAGGMSREEVLDSFVASEEFQGILAKYGLK